MITQADASRRTPWLEVADAALVGAILLFSLWWASTVAFANAWLAEDAAMLLRYAEHLGEGLGLRWNPQGPPVDGATDFAFVLLVGAAHWFGASVEAAGRAITIVSHAATVILIYRCARRSYPASRWPAVLAALFVAVGPGLKFIQAGFGTPLFALLCAIAWICALELSAGGGSRRAMTFAVAAFLLGLSRPEGVLLSAFMLAAIAIISPAAGRRALIVMVGVFGICGGVYLVWRSIYFGHMLPGPYLKKGGLHLHFDGLSNASTNAARLLLPLAALALVGLSPKVSRRAAAAHLVPLVGFIAIWVLLSPEMNYQGRFQYAIVPLAMISWPMLVRPRVLRPVAIGALALALCAYQYRRFGADHYHLDGRSAVGIALRDVPGHCMAVTEAGLLPYRSHWCAIDTWGLNDDEIRRDGVTDAYLDRFAPAIVMIHPDDQVHAWTVMVDRLRRYVSARPYVLAAEYSIGADDVHLYYVRKDIPDAARIVALVRGVPYLWHDTNAYATNAAPEPALGGSSRQLTRPGAQ